MTEIPELIQKIHDSPQQAVLAVAGAGNQAIAWLLGVAGASRTLLELVVPYGPLSMQELVGYEPSQFVSEKTAQDMARATYQRALRLRQSPVPVLGLGCTATIATDRPKRGEHRCHIATWDQDRVTTYTLILDKGYRDRAGEDDVVSRLLVQALAQACRIEEEPEVGLTPADRLTFRRQDHGDPLARLLAGEVTTVTVRADGCMEVDQPVSGTILPGSFSPLHQGHDRLAQTAADILGDQVSFELSVVNVDKPPLAESEVRRRVRQFSGKANLVLTRAETFRKKASLFPGCTFVIGWDTAVRLVAPRYYGGDTTAMLTALAEMWTAGCRFLVAGREDDTGSFRTLDDVPIPEGFTPLFQSIPESLFREDISSTALRERG